ncbi:hypothetical protein GOBAR_AA24095 [Gossypium barbadense]|uniref:Cupin type-1 domain-containing protein n=1 Tax=Gossypium barbadense TaxID=3634 RepID=A0A2P5WZU5_GOSBA|nr:hypothetical protein GOBAR_AA24095 [Gossypium barbadense]
MSNNDQEADNLESVFKQKRIIRSNVRQTLKSMDPSLRSQEDDIIQSIVLEAPWFKSSKRLCAYTSCSALREVDTSKLLSQILSPAPVMHANDPVDLFILPVALSYSVQIMDEEVIPVTPNDVLVDALVSPTGVIPITSAALGSNCVRLRNGHCVLLCNFSEAMNACPPVNCHDLCLLKAEIVIVEEKFMSAMVSLLFHLLCCLTVFWLLPLPSHSADPDPLQDFCVANLSASISVNGFPCKPASEVTSDDFFFDGFTQEGNTTNAFSSFLTPGNVLSFPGLNTLGISMNRVDFAPGGINPPHSHPRASEVGVVIEGKLLVGFVTTNNVYYSKVLTAGHMFAIPRGLVVLAGIRQKYEVEYS